MAFFGLTDLEQVGSYTLTPTGDPTTTSDAGIELLTCVDAGPGASTPVLLACGTGGGALVLVGLPLIHFWKELESANTFAAALLQSLPVKLVKDTVNMAFHTLGRVRERLECVCCCPTTAGRQRASLTLSFLSFPFGLWGW